MILTARDLLQAFLEIGPPYICHVPEPLALGARLVIDGHPFVVFRAVTHAEAAERYRGVSTHSFEFDAHVSLPYGYELVTD